MAEAQDASQEEGTDDRSSAEQAQDSHEKAQDKMKKLEEADEVPTNLEDWPDDDAKYVTFGGTEGDHSYEDGPESKLGPSSLERHGDGSVSIEGEKVDNPEDYKAEPVPGGPTDPDAPVMRGEQKKRDKMEEMYGEDALPDALQHKCETGSDSEERTDD